MSTRNTFAAPWGTSIWALTLLGVIIFLGLPLTSWVFHPANTPWWPLFLVILPLAFLGIVALFAVRGYTVDKGNVYVQRVGWRSCISLHQLESAMADPQAMQRSVRLWGNGGLFGFTGYYWNRRLGRYRAYATHFDYAVVLTFPDRRVVVTPDDPEAFVQAVLTA